MRFTTCLLAGATFITSEAIAQEAEVTVPCTIVEIIQNDGTKRLNQVPQIDFLEHLGKIDTGPYSGTTMTIILQGNGEILCQLHEQQTSDSE